MGFFMKDIIDQLHQSFKTEIKNLSHLKEAEALKIKYLGKKGLVADLMLQLKEASTEERPILGKLINTLKVEIEDLLSSAFTTLESVERAKKLETEKMDISLPGRRKSLGRKHPISIMTSQVVTICKEMGFSVQLGPDIDSDFYNFEGLNYPADHPARDMQDTFYITKEYLLRSHTSNTQLRVMQTHKPPIRIIVPGTVYRNEDISARSHVFFHQVEGLYVDKGVSFADLLSTMRLFWNKLFGYNIETRFRPSFFPFVEPGIEIDITCTSCKGKGCNLCKKTGWLEVAGAGLVHPEVLKNGGIDPEEYSGFAWGLGIERLAMLLYGVKDIRQFAENDTRLLSQFNC